MQRASITAVLVGFLSVGVISCAPTVQNAPAQQGPGAGIKPSCPPVFQLANMQPLTCGVQPSHLLEIGNASSTAVPSGTVVSYMAMRLSSQCDKAGRYCGSVALREPIPQHLSVVITGQPPFDDMFPCQAWWEVPPVLTQ